MRLINREIEVSLNLLQVAWSKPNSIFRSEDLAASINEALPFVQKQLDNLRAKGYLISHRGPSGGFQHSPKVESETLAQFLDDMGAPLSLDKDASLSRAAMYTSYHLDKIADDILLTWLFDQANKSGAV